MAEHELALEFWGRVSGPLAALSGSSSKAPGFAGGYLLTQIREAATDRLVFLVGNTAKEIGFEIRDLKGPCQMYLTRRETIELRHL
jgi:hypothetical protein